MEDSTQFFERLLRSLPECSRVYQQHLDTYGELISIVALGEITTESLEAYKQGSPNSHGIFCRLSDFISEELLTANERLRDLIIQSFADDIEGLSYTDVDFYNTVNMDKYA